MAVNNVTGGTDFTAPVGTASAAAKAQSSNAAAQAKQTKYDTDYYAKKYGYNDTYEKSTEKTDDPTKTVYKRDTVKVAQLRAQDDAYISNLQNLVNELLNQTGKNAQANGANSWQTAGGLDPNKVESYWDLLVDNGDGTFSFHPDLSPEMQDKLISKAQEDIGENGYYGVKQTSQRILDFAKAITGGDPSKIGEMRKMAQEAFDDVAKIMGGKLPEISQKTYDAVMKGFDEWEAAAKEKASTTAATTGVQ